MGQEIVIAEKEHARDQDTHHDLFFVAFLQLSHVIPVARRRDRRQCGWHRVDRTRRRPGQSM